MSLRTVKSRGAFLVLIFGAACALFAASLVLTADSPSTPAGRTFFVSPRGDNGDSGGRGHALRTIQAALRRVRPGDTVVVSPGLYGRRGAISRLSPSGTAEKPIRLIGRRGSKRPRLRGQVRLDGDHLRVRRFVFDGPTGPVSERSGENPGGEDVQLWVRGNDAVVADSEIRDNLWHAGIYVTADGTRLLRNYVHDNGDRSNPDNANLDHGIYWASGQGGVASDNLIVRNVAYGLQLFPEPRGVRVLHNTLAANGKGGLILAEETTGTEVANNIIAFNGSPGIDFELDRIENVVHNNLFWENGELPLASPAGLREIGNFVADPGFLGPNDYRLGPGSEAIGRALPQFTTPTDNRGRPRPERSADLGALEAPSDMR
jgi:Right handed beta helix region